MKLSNVFAKLTSAKLNVARVLAAATLAGGLMMAAVPAEAQHFAVGVRIGGPRYFAPPPPRYYGYYGHYDPYRYDRYREHEEWVRHHEYRYGYDR